MWQLLLGPVGAIITIGLAAKGIYEILESEVSYHHEQWEDKREEVKQEIINQSEKITEYKEIATGYLSYRSLIDLHFASVQLANEAYKLLEDCFASINAINKALHSAKIKLNEWKDDLKTIRSKKKSAEIKEEIKSLKEFRNELFNEREKLFEQKDSFLEKVKELNNKTRELKEQIKNSGNKGWDWYYRHELKNIGKSLSKKRRTGGSS